MFSSNQLGRLSDLLLEYLEVKSELIKAQVKDHIVQIVTNLLVIFIFMGFALLITLLGSFALSYYINDYFDSSYLGFVVVMGIIILFSVLMYFTRKTLMKAVVYKTISKYFESEGKGKGK